MVLGSLVSSWFWVTRTLWFRQEKPSHGAWKPGFFLVLGYQNLVVPARKAVTWCLEAWFLLGSGLPEPCGSGKKSRHMVLGSLVSSWFWVTRTLWFRQEKPSHGAWK